MKFYAPFCLPFLVGALVMAAVIAWKYVVWFAELPRADKKRVLFGIPTPRTLGAVGEVIGECLLHRRIFRVNPLLGYMHMSLAFGWFLLIVVGWIETVAYLGLRWVPLQGHVFFKYFAPTLMLREKPFFDFVTVPAPSIAAYITFSDMFILPYYCSCLALALYLTVFLLYDVGVKSPRL